LRKYLYLAMAAGAALAMASPMIANAAPAGHTNVLTAGKAGGAPVKVGAVLAAGLAKGTTASFSFDGMNLTCKTANFSAKVTKNPTAPGKATESLTSQKIAKCSIKFPGLTIKSVAIGNLPYNITTSDAKGDPVTISGTSKKKPLQFTANVSFSGMNFSCVYIAASVSGTASNKGNTITFKNQKTAFSKGSSDCPTSSNFSAKFGPVTDSSVKHDPAVFVN
jgi:hypothetical protein